MPFAVQVEAGESIVFNDSYQASERSDPFAVAITDRAIYLLAKKTFAVADPWYFRRIPITDVRELAVARLHRPWLLLLAVPMILAGGYATYAMLEPVLSGRGGTVSGVPIAVFVGGLLLPVASLGRRGLCITLTHGRVTWRPPLVLDRTSRARIESLLDSIRAAAREMGIHTRSAGGP